jgi:predicted acyltransferase
MSGLACGAFFILDGQSSDTMDESPPFQQEYLNSVSLRKSVRFIYVHKRMDYFRAFSWVPGRTSQEPVDSAINYFNLHAIFIDQNNCMPTLRLKSIDVFRAVTMFLMIFVNDLWTLHGVPVWLEHMPAGADGLGFSDIIFPAFLFIVGLSVPLAIRSRLSRGDSSATIFTHILLRTLALLIMGLFHVNLESYSSTAVLPKPYWEILITVGFFMIWLDYPKEKRRLREILQIAGILILVVMAMIYKGETDNGEVVWMKTYWWGILGLIGWAYFFSSVIYLLLRRNRLWLAGIFLLVLILNVCSHLGWPFLPLGWKSGMSWLSFIDTTNIGLVMGGVLASVFYAEMNEKTKRIALLYTLAAASFLLYGFISRPLWGISKIGGTPSWMAICLAISLAGFLILIWLVDKRGKENWFRWIRAGGTATLTCYLLPYLHYPLLTIWPGLRLPDAIRTGLPGIIKSLLYALIIILLTELLAKKRIRLKL